jgi:hypothetical protein
MTVSYTLQVLTRCRYIHCTISIGKSLVESLRCPDAMITSVVASQVLYNFQHTLTGSTIAEDRALPLGKFSGLPCLALPELVLLRCHDRCRAAAHTLRCRRHDVAATAAAVAPTATVAAAAAAAIAIAATCVLPPPPLRACWRRR